MAEYHLDDLLAGITPENIHDEEFPYGELPGIRMPRDLTDEQADAALRATAVWLEINGSQLTVNREKMKARYRALVKYIENQLAAK